jgi:hypothetical protein
MNTSFIPLQFLADHVRLEDVRLYLRDLLREYAALQTFQPFRSEEARCVNWDRMLAEFSAPHRRPSYVRLFSCSCLLPCVYDKYWPASAPRTAGRLTCGSCLRTCLPLLPVHPACRQGGTAGGVKHHAWAPNACSYVSAVHTAPQKHKRYGSRGASWETIVITSVLPITRHLWCSFRMRITRRAATEPALAARLSGQQRS